MLRLDKFLYFCSDLIQYDIVEIEVIEWLLMTILLSLFFLVFCCNKNYINLIFYLEIINIFYLKVFIIHNILY